MSSRRAHRHPARPRRIYVPVLHGIGTRDHRDWALASVGRIADHLRTGDAWRETPCPPGCSDYADGHRHVAGPSDVEAVLDPLSWFSAVPEPTRRDAATWFVRALFLLCCVHLLVNAQAILSGVGAVRITFRRPAKALVDVVGAIWRTLRGMMWILVIGSATIAGAIIGPPVVMLSARARELVADALAWTSTGASRDAVLTAVGTQMRRPRSDHVLLVGHSQGGAIAAAQARGLPKRRTAVLTLGSGLALLAAVRAAADVRGRVVGAFVVAIITYVALAALVMWQVLAAAVAGAGLTLLALSQIAGAIWSAGAEAPAAVAWHMLQLGHVADATVALAIAAQPDARLLIAAIPVGVVVVTIYYTAIHPVAQKVIAECQVTAPGLDLSAVFDPVSHPLAALGPQTRVRRITQAASLADHVLYFRNRIEVLRTIEAQLTDVANRSTTASQQLRDDLARESHLATRLDRIGRATTAVVAAAIAPAIWPLLGVTGAIAAGLAAYAAGTAMKRRRWGRRQSRPDARTLRRLRCRPRHAWIHAAVTFAGAMVMVGAVTSPARPDSPIVGALAVGAYTLLALGVPAALARSLWAPWILAVGLTASAIVWLTEGTATSSIGGGVALALAVAYAATQARRLARAPRLGPRRTRGSSRREAAG